MKKKHSGKKSQTDLKHLETAGDEDIDLSDIPEIKPGDLQRAEMRYGGQKVAQGKIRINIYLDTDIVAHFKARAGGRGYQTLINDALRQTIERENLETMLRRVIREESAGYSTEVNKDENRSSE